ncbi:MAG: hypothetical protein WBA93_26390 [Microcoleaceae cyanobacterium]
MKILEQTSTHLILKDSVRAAWALRLFSMPFFIFGCIGIFLVISEKNFPSLFIILCLLFGIPGVLLTAVKKVVLDKNQNKLIVTVQRLLINTKKEYLLSGLNVSVKETPFVVKTYSSILTTKKEPICIVLLEYPAYSRKIKLSGNYSFTRNEAVEIANLIRTFLTTPL